MSDQQKTTPYGQGDSSFRAAGGEEGVFNLVKDFYTLMGNEKRFKTIYEMHPDDISTSQDKLARFLCGWLGGPKRYQEKYGSINIPQVHSHLKIGFDEEHQWLTCMSEAIDLQPYNTEFKRYLIQQLSIPAQIIRKACSDAIIK